MIEVIVITGRTTDQGMTIDEKLSNDYMKAVCYCEMNERDMSVIGVNEGDRVKIKTEFGEVVLYAKKAVTKDLELPEGVVFIPMGPYANQVVGKSNGSGTPQYKGIKGYVEATQEDVKPVEELIRVVK
ncbi:molybdopterin dinucleotide binding domain-containing protein [Archaeoglobus veneficus]|uniref:Molybdopterin dinucleotide-binding region n=1 Tax=Archaeoglobus veneficus (strain DSM 11195 / SNP6) TaxID=693661 RepID=F2KPH6_ARCVS|nr:molybdopterin dinucleotide binding domain-containing protein [Archaeoglobus veneficus]AEA46407.1 molybdopterin dinucleotide-binding region [Archaeoglobus veneficus SNP6]